MAHVTDDNEDIHYVGISDDVYMGVSKKNGMIAGPTAEGTLGIIFYGIHQSDLQNTAEPRTEKAIKIPRLLQADQLLNFHVAEIGFHEGNQAHAFTSSPGLLGATSFFRQSYARHNAVIPTRASKPCFVGFFLSPTSKYEICLLAENDAWPERFKERVGGSDDVKALFDDVAKYSRNSQPGIKHREMLFNNLLFLPHRRPDRRSSGNGALTILGRDELAATHLGRDVDGWWFNLPVAIYPWMSINLERILNGLMEDPEGDDTDSVDAPNPLSPSADPMDQVHYGVDAARGKPVSEVFRGVGIRERDRIEDSLAVIRDWNLYSWFRLATGLADGIKSLHQRGAIHGDTRPANIMTDARESHEVSPSNFRWIDIGLGYGALGSDGSFLQSEETVITPPPLGGGRTTPFYAPERIEVTEYEDADTVTFTPSQISKGTLRFGWRRHTNDNPATVHLKKTFGAVRELGRLEKGDRIQVREFLFEVDNVDRRSIEISGVYEIFLDRVLIQLVGKDIQKGYEHLDGASISRYRIFKHWSQATDIYGLGVVILYIFFMRGVSLEKFQRTHGSTPGRKSSDAELLYSSPFRDDAFEDMISLLRNEGILVNMLEVLAEPVGSDGKAAGGPPRSVEHLFKENLTKLIGDKELLKIFQVLTDVDSNFKYVWKGLDCDYERFTQLIVGFCMCCLWRGDEIRDVLEKYKRGYGKTIAIDFVPFCDSRSRILDTRRAAEPAAAAWKRLDDLSQLIGSAAGSTQSHPPKHTEYVLGPTSRDLIYQLKDLRTDNENLVRDRDEQRRHNDRLNKQLAGYVRKSESLEQQLESCRTSVQTYLKHAKKEITEVLDHGSSWLKWVGRYSDLRKQLNDIAEGVGLWLNHPQDPPRGE